MTSRIVWVLTMTGAVMLSRPPARAQSLAPPHAMLAVELPGTTSIGAIEGEAPSTTEAAGFPSAGGPDAAHATPRRHGGGREPKPDRTSTPTVEIRAIGARRTNWHPQLSLSFDGIRMRDSRLADGGRTFTVEPPDQGLCARNDLVLETVNQALRVYDPMGRL